MTFDVTTQFRIMTCCVSSCSIMWGAPAQWIDWRRKDHQFFYCPNGHSQHFAPSPEEAEAERLKVLATAEAARKKAERRRQERQEWLDEQARARADLRKNGIADTQLVRVARALWRSGEFTSRQAVEEWLHKCKARDDRYSGIHNVGTVGIKAVRAALAENSDLLFELMHLPPDQSSENASQKSREHQDLGASQIDGVHHDQ